MVDIGIQDLRESRLRACGARGLVDDGLCGLRAFGGCRDKPETNKLCHCRRKLPTTTDTVAFRVWAQGCIGVVS